MRREWQEYGGTLREKPLRHTLYFGAKEGVPSFHKFGIAGCSTTNGTSTVPR